MTIVVIVAAAATAVVVTTGREFEFPFIPLRTIQGLKVNALLVL